MSNLFDDLIPGSNTFGDLVPKRDPKIGQPEELSWMERNVAPALDMAGKFVGHILSPTNDQGLEGVGISRGGAVGRLAQGAADPGVAVVQLAANATPWGGDVNKAIAEKEAEYQAARKAEGSEGFDPLRMVGQTGISMLVPGMTAAGSGVMRGAAVGAGSSLLTPVTDGGEDFWKEKGKQAAVGAAGGAILSPIAGAAARIVSPKASINPDVKALENEGVTGSLGQTLGGWANAIEEKAQSLPFVGAMIERARQKGAGQLEDAAWARVGKPIGQTIQGRGNAAVADAESKLGAEYDKVLPKLSVDVLDPNFIGKMGSLRSMVQSLPQDERTMFDSILAREIDGRVQPNGVLGGNDLKDAWRALRSESQSFGRSDDPYQQKLGMALKQALQELKDHVSATNAPADVAALKNTDFAYANFKRMQKAASSVGAEGGSPTPAQLYSATKAADTSKDKAAFARGDALMQDLAGAGKRILTNRVPDSGTAGRTLLGLAAGGGALLSPKVAMAIAGGMGAYTTPAQNALRALVASRPGAAPAMANYLRMLANPAAVAVAPLYARVANDR